MQGQFSLLRELLQPDTAKARVWMQVNSDITYIHGIPSRLSEVALRFDIDWLAELLIGKITFELEDDFAPDCLAEAVRGEGKVLAVLLKHPKGKSLRIEERVVTQIARIFDENVMELLLDHRGEEVKITAEVVEAVAANDRGKEMMELLLDRCGEEVKITAEIVNLAAANDRGKEMMKLLLDRRGEEVKITAEVVEAVATNYRGKEMMELLLDRRGEEVKITAEVVEAAAANKDSGEMVMKLLLDRCGEEVKITEEVVQAAAANSKEMMELLLDRRGEEVKITAEIVNLAAANDRGKEMMKLLLDRRGEEVKITAEVVQAAAANSKEMMKLLLDTAEIYMQSIHARRQAACIPEAILPSHPPCKGACCTIGQYPVLHRLHFRRMRTLPCPWNNFHPLRPECFQECSGRIENSEGSYALSVS